MTVREIRLRIFEIVRPMIPNRKPLKDRKQLEEEYDYFFKKRDGSYLFDNKLYDIEIHNNLPDNPATGGLFQAASKVRCDFCLNEHKDNCMFAF